MRVKEEGDLRKKLIKPFKGKKEKKKKENFWMSFVSTNTKKRGKKRMELNGSKSRTQTDSSSIKKHTQTVCSTSARCNCAKLFLHFTILHSCVGVTSKDTAGRRGPSPGSPRGHRHTTESRNMKQTHTVESASLNSAHIQYMLS